jgi:ferredoxin-NADP reductase
MTADLYPGRYMQGKVNTMLSTLKFVHQRHEAGDTASFFFRSERPFAFLAGQYIGLTLPHQPPDSRGIARSFTIASAPAEPPSCYAVVGAGH